MNLKEKYSQWIKEEAQRLGFITCGIAKASFLEEEAPRLERWLNQKRHAGLHYMENYFDKRLDPGLLVEGARSVISLLYNYYPSKKQRSDTYRISKYAYGQDYHHVLKSKLRDLHDFITERIGEVHGRAFVDSAPVLDKAWAERAGLGWIGKNTLLLQKQRGSFHFVCELIVDLELAYDQPVTDHCGSCKRCIDACPTQAIVQPYEIDASRCISYMTIELKDQLIPSGSEEKFQDWIFGCDICQDVCPWNRFARATESPLLQPQDETWLDFSKRDWEEITEEVFQKIFKKSALKRAKYTGFKRNINYVKRSKEETTTY